MKTLLICHEGMLLDHEGMMRWLASFSELTGVVVLRETGGRTRQRIRSQIKRVGYLRFADVLAFRLYYKLRHARSDRMWEERRLAELRREYPHMPDAPALITHSPNTAEAEEFIKRHKPDLIVARCKTLIKKRVFSIPARGTFVMHPGVAPEYRNSHGCFWALARRDLDRVGMTLLRIDEGVDTGPIYGYYAYPFDEATESHVVIQHRVTFDSLKEIEAKLREIAEGRAEPLAVEGRDSGTWGQPWLTSYLKWKRAARKRKAEVLAERSSGKQETRA